MYDTQCKQQYASTITPISDHARQRKSHRNSATCHTRQKPSVTQTTDHSICYLAEVHTTYVIPTTTLVTATITLGHSNDHTGSQQRSHSVTATITLVTATITLGHSNDHTGLQQRSHWVTATITLVTANSVNDSAMLTFTCWWLCSAARMAYVRRNHIYIITNAWWHCWSFSLRVTAGWHHLMTACIAAVWCLSWSSTGTKSTWTRSTVCIQNAKVLFLAQINITKFLFCQIT